MLRAGMRNRDIVAALGVTKNVIAGIALREGLSGESNHIVEEPSTLFERCARLHDRMDRVLAETMGVGRIPNEPAKARGQ